MAALYVECAHTKFVDLALTILRAVKHADRAELAPIDVNSDFETAGHYVTKLVALQPKVHLRYGLSQHRVVSTVNEGALVGRR